MVGVRQGGRNNYLQKRTQLGNVIKVEVKDKIKKWGRSSKGSTRSVSRCVWCWVGMFGRPKYPFTEDVDHCKIISAECHQKTEESLCVQKANRPFFN